MTETREIDRESARRAFEMLEPRLRLQSELRTMSTDVHRAAIFAAAIGRMVSQPEVRERFASLPAAEFDITHVDNLEPAAHATLYAQIMLASASAHNHLGKISPELAREAARLKQRMFKVVEYHLGDEANIATELAGIRKGKGYMDLAADLLRLARLYELHEAALAVDRRHYQPGDRDDAHRLAYRIHFELGQGNAAQRWTETLHRAWSLLLDTYEEVRATGRWLYRHEDGDARFPSLFTMGRSKRRRKRAPASQAAPAAESTPAE